MAHRAALHMKKGKTWLLHMNENKGSTVVRRKEALAADRYGDGGNMSGFDPRGLGRYEVPCGISLHSYPLDIVDYFGHYFLPVEKAA